MVLSHVATTKGKNLYLLILSNKIIFRLNRKQSVSRWNELTESLKFHAEVAHLGKHRTEFRFLNRRTPVRIGFDVTEDDAQYRLFQDICKTSPNGATPLCRHIADVATEICQHAQYLNENGLMACVIIATDGEASDGNIYTALQALTALPVMVVVRLCTNESKVVEYWNRLEKNLEIRLDVIDDLIGEAEEVKQVNSWVTYAEPLQRMREFGVTMKELDILDEETLSWENVLRILALIYGPEMVNKLPPVEDDWDQFFNVLQEQINTIALVSSSSSNEKQQKEEIFCPLHNQKRSWISIPEIQRIYAPKIPSSKLSSSFSTSSSSSSTAWNVAEGSTEYGRFSVVIGGILLLLLLYMMYPSEVHTCLKQYHWNHWTSSIL